jgi:two-component system sensor histidine kinase YesM
MEYCFGEQVSVTWFYFYFNFFINLQSTIVLVFLAYFVYYIEYTKSKELIEKTKQIEYLKKQVSPHLLLNELNSLYYVASSNKNSELTERIKNLINWLRYSLYKIEQNSISIKEEIEHLENYFIHIKHYSNFPQNNINFHNSLSDKEMDIKIPPLTLFTFVENCVKHSHFLYIKNSSIRIIFESIDNKIYFKFENSVTGNQQNPSQKETQGLGIQNVKNRLKHHFDGDWKITQSTNNQAHYTEIIIFK